MRTVSVTLAASKLCIMTKVRWNQIRSWEVEEHTGPGQTILCIYAQIQIRVVTCFIVKNAMQSSIQKGGDDLEMQLLK